MYGSLDIERNRQNFLSFWTGFCPFTYLWTQKIKILKKWKNTWRYYHFTNVYHKWQSYDVWLLRYGVQQTEFFLIFDHFLTFYPSNNPKIKLLKNWKNAWRYFHFKHVYHKWQSYDAWFLRYQAQRTEVFVSLDRVLPFYPPNNSENQNFQKLKINAWRYYHFAHVYHKWHSYDVRFLRYRAWWTKFFVILDHFLLFYPSSNPKNQKFEKMKKIPGDIIILHKCIKNHDHMLHCSWDMAHDGCNYYFSFWGIFCPFTPPNSPKNQNFKKIKKIPGDIIILHMCTKNYD